MKQLKTCMYCVNQLTVDYKDADTLATCLTPYKTIAARRRTGACAWHQRKISRAIKQARIMGLLPFVNNGT